MKYSVVLPSLLGLATAICHHGTKLAARQAESVDYSYHGVQGALFWHTLSSDNAICGTGKNQSPIDLIDGIETVRGSSYRLSIDKYPNGLELENLGHTIQANLNGTATFDGEQYSLVQFHFHTPSEHHINGEYYPMEVHFVFQDEDEALAVIGFMIDTAGDGDTPSALLLSILRNVHEIPDQDNVTATEPLDFSDLHQQIRKSRVYSYDGSLTTPPCSEGVRFNVVAEPMLVEVGLFRAMRRIIKFNSRFTQNTPGQDNLLELLGQD